MAIEQKRQRVLRWSLVFHLSQVLSSIILLAPSCQAFTTPITSISIGHSSIATQAQQSPTELFFFGSSANNHHESTEPKVAYMIERIGTKPSVKTYRDIADMCINVFFKEALNAKPDDRVAPWKEAQISYLKTLQAGDLKRRRERYPDSNEMFLAYEVKEANLESFRNQPLLLDLDRVYNLQSLSSSHNRNTEYVRGDILGFCEITQRSYGLGHIDETEMMRPILTNLAVSQEARTYGIGSKLLDECERHVAQHWKMSEMVLEVEDYNNVALEFYAKRGYQVIFNDPASRRFDVGGLMLRKVRCTRQILRKVLAQQRAQSASEEYGATWDLFQKFRETVGVF